MTGAVIVVVAILLGLPLLAWWVGRHIGLDEYHRLLTEATPGTEFGKPQDLRAKRFGLDHGFIPQVRGLLQVGPFAAAATYTLLAGWSKYPSLRPSAEAPVEAPPPSWGSATWQTPTAAPEPPVPGEAGPPRG